MFARTCSGELNRGIHSAQVSWFPSGPQVVVSELEMRTEKQELIWELLELEHGLQSNKVSSYCFISLLIALPYLRAHVFF